MRPSFKGKPKGQLLGKGPQGLAAESWLFPSSQSYLQPCSLSACRGCIVKGRAWLSSLLLPTEHAYAMRTG